MSSLAFVNTIPLSKVFVTYLELCTLVFALPSTKHLQEQFLIQFIAHSETIVHAVLVTSSVYEDHPSKVLVIRHELLRTGAP